MLPSLKEIFMMPSNLTNATSPEYEKAVTALVTTLAQHPIILAFQAAEKRLKAAEALYALEVEMKDLAKQAVLYQKIEKIKAYEATLAQSKAIEAQLNAEPIVIDYRRKMLAANDLLQHLLQNIESQINEELYRDN